MSELVNNAWDVLKKEQMLDDESVGTTVMNVIRCLEEYGLDESQKLLVLEKVERLVKESSVPFKITSEPTQWSHIDTELYQNKQLPNVFSNDGGEHYYFQNDPMTVFESEKI